MSTKYKGYIRTYKFFTSFTCTRNKFDFRTPRDCKVILILILLLTFYILESKIRNDFIDDLVPKLNLKKLRISECVQQIF